MGKRFLAHDRGGFDSRNDLIRLFVGPFPEVL
jgi:hypothetical protein